MAMGDGGATQLVMRLAQAVGLSLPDERVAVVAAAVAELQALVDSLRELPLEDAEPAFGPQRW